MLEEITTLRKNHGHNSNASDREYNRWGGHKQISLLHLNQIQVPFTVPSKALIQGIQYYISCVESAENIEATTPIKTVANNWIKVIVFHKQGNIEGGIQLFTYLLYMAFRSWKYQAKLRDSIRRRKKLGKQLEEFVFQYEGKPYNLFSLLLEEGTNSYNTLSEKGRIPIPHIYEKQEKYNVVEGYVSKEEAWENFNPLALSFDK